MGGAWLGGDKPYNNIRQFYFTPCLNFGTLQDVLLDKDRLTRAARVIQLTWETLRRNINIQTLEENPGLTAESNFRNS